MNKITGDMIPLHKTSLINPITSPLAQALIVGIRLGSLGLAKDGRRIKIDDKKIACGEAPAITGVGKMGSKFVEGELSRPHMHRELSS